MTAPVDTTAVLKDALAFIEEAGANHHDQKHVAKIRGDLERTISEIASANRITCIKGLAHLIGASPETARRTLLRLFPETAKRRGRFKITPEMVAAVVADRS